MSLALYYHPLASYCHKVLVALYENGTPFEKQLINLGDATDKAQLQAIWPLAKFPVLRDHARHKDLAETTVIIEYLDHYYPGAQPLLPKDWDEALEVRLWDRLCDNYLQGPMQQIVIDRMRGTHADLSRERATLQTAYGMLERRLAGTTWLGGANFSLSDCAAAPALFFVSTLEPFPPEFTHLRAYLERLTARPSFRRVLEEAKPYFSMYPFADAIPDRFR